MVYNCALIRENSDAYEDKQNNLIPGRLHIFFKRKLLKIT